MASSSAGTAPVTLTGPPTGKRDLLYERCLDRPIGSIFDQASLIDYYVADDKHELALIINELMVAHLFFPVKDGALSGPLKYGTRRRDIANKLLYLTQNEKDIYTHIESTASSGIWLRSLRAKTNLHQTVVTKCLKELVSKHLIKEIKSAKFPGRKIYMLWDLEPSEENTGGSFFTDGELDEALVENLSNFVVDFVESKSWAEQTTPSAARTKGKKDDALAKKRKRPITIDTDEDEDQPAGKKPAGRTSTSLHDASTITTSASKEPPLYITPTTGHHKRALIPYPPSYPHYPTTATVTTYILGAGIINASLSLGEADVQQLLDLLVFDGKLERMGEAGYRSVRKSVREEDVGNAIGVGMGNGVTSTPCCGCPVFDLCEVDGPVNAANCVYFDEWLAF